MAQCQQDLLSGLLKLGHRDIQKQEWIACTGSLRASEQLT